MSAVTEQWEFLKDVARLINKAEGFGFVLTGGELYRTTEQQKIYFETGKSKTMNSNHLKRLAIDFNFFINGKLIYAKKDIQPLGDYWESLNSLNRWGGNFKSFQDTPHFERNIV
jgi:hypothetical protein